MHIGMAQQLAKVLAEKLTDGDLSKVVDELRKSAPRRSGGLGQQADGATTSSTSSVPSECTLLEVFVCDSA